MTSPVSKRSLIIRLLFALCLLAATVNHLQAVINHGWLWDYGYGAGTWLGSRLFWGALTILDPLAVWLLFARPNAGLTLTTAIILTDVAHNTFYVATHQQWLASFYLSQVAFMVAVILLAPLAWQRRASLIPEPDRAPAPSSPTRAR